MNWDNVGDLLNRDALYSFTDRSLSYWELMLLTDTFNPSDKHDWNELLYTFYLESNPN